MITKIRELLSGKAENHILPFFWQHGEDEATLRKMMAAIHGTNCQAVCVESRPHPDFCGPKWWRDMDVILDEARKRNMKVWILDDSHFPTGFANGAVLKAPQGLCRQNILCNTVVLEEKPCRLRLDLRGAGLLEIAKPKNLSPMAAMMMNRPPERVYDDDRILGVTALHPNGREENLTAFVEKETLVWDKPAGHITLRVITASRNTGAHRAYINMTDRDSVKILLDAVYEPHWQHYADDFGTTIAGFFSDEPELGNGLLYTKGNYLGSYQDLPWGAELEQMIAAQLGENWVQELALLWEPGTDARTARVHTVYMDCLTKLVRKNFSQQVSAWCHDHGVSYIGHVIEDDGQHCKTASSLGHYFRSLQGQDMAGIDDIGGQVLPQGEDEPTINSMRQPRNGEFYHYALAKLAQSAAAIEPPKQGNAMCEIFGNYGWAEGVRLEKYLADHFLVRGINQFVPHAFSGKEFPDSDCPPHFYAHGHNPQYRHFGVLMAYLNRVATLTGSGRHDVPVAILYHGESEWCDPEAMPFEKPLRVLYDAQIDCHTVPADVFAESAYYRTVLGNPLQVNEQHYRAFVVPSCRRIPQAAAEGLEKLVKLGLPVFFVDRLPHGTCEGMDALPDGLNSCPVVSLSQLTDAVLAAGIQRPVLQPASDRMRILKIQTETPGYLLVNEAAEAYTGSIFLPGDSTKVFAYNAWDNRCERVACKKCSNGTKVQLIVEPLKSVFLICGKWEGELYIPPIPTAEISINTWTRSKCAGSEYPYFTGHTNISLPDDVSTEAPEFSGFIRYETTFHLDGPGDLLMEILDAQEGVEAFLNGESQGIQIAPPMRYALKGRAGENNLTIEVATTLERQCYPLLTGYRKILATPPAVGTGLTGSVVLYKCK